MGDLLQFPQPTGPRTDGRRFCIDVLCTACDGFITIDVDLSAALATKDVDTIDQTVGREVNCALLEHHNVSCPARHAT